MPEDMKPGVGWAQFGLRARTMVCMFAVLLVVAFVVMPIQVLWLAFQPATPLWMRAGLIVGASLLLGIAGGLVFPLLKRRVKTGRWKISAEERRQLAERRANRPESNWMGLLNYVNMFVLPLVWMAIAAIYVRRAVVSPHRAYDIAYAIFLVGLAVFPIVRGRERARRRIKAS